MAVITYSLPPISICKERRILLLSGTLDPDTFEEYQFWIYNYVIYQKNTNLDNQIIQLLVRFAGGEITKKTTMLGDTYYNIKTSYAKKEYSNWKNMLENFITQNT
jgi:hypothetical protein